MQIDATLISVLLVGILVGILAFPAVYASMSAQLEMVEAMQQDVDDEPGDK